MFFLFTCDIHRVHPGRGLILVKFVITVLAVLNAHGFTWMWFHVVNDLTSVHGQHGTMSHQWPAVPIAACIVVSWICVMIFIRPIPCVSSDEPIATLESRSVDEPQPKVNIAPISLCSLDQDNNWTRRLRFELAWNRHDKVLHDLVSGLARVCAHKYGYDLHSDNGLADALACTTKYICAELDPNSALCRDKPYGALCLDWSTISVDRITANDIHAFVRTDAIARHLIFGRGRLLELIDLLDFADSLGDAQAVHAVAHEIHEYTTTRGVTE